MNVGLSELPGGEHAVNRAGRDSKVVEGFANHVLGGCDGEEMLILFHLTLDGPGGLGVFSNAGRLVNVRKVCGEEMSILLCAIRGVGVGANHARRVPSNDQAVIRAKTLAELMASAFDDVFGTIVEN